MDRYHPNQRTTLVAYSGEDKNTVSCDKHKDCDEEFLYVCLREPSQLHLHLNGVGIIKSFNADMTMATVLWDSNFTLTVPMRNLQVLS